MRTRAALGEERMGRFIDFDGRKYGHGDIIVVLTTPLRRGLIGLLARPPELFLVIEDVERLSVTSISLEWRIMQALNPAAQQKFAKSYSAIRDALLFDKPYEAPTYDGVHVIPANEFDGVDEAVAA